MVSNCNEPIPSVALTSTVQSHAPSARKVVLLETAAVNSLLGQDIAAPEQHLEYVRPEEFEEFEGFVVPRW